MQREWADMPLLVNMKLGPHKATMDLSVHKIMVGVMFYHLLEGESMRANGNLGIELYSLRYRIRQR